MSAIVLALCASVAWGAGDFLGGLSARRAPTLTVLALSQLTGLALVAIVVVATWRAVPSWSTAGAAVVAGLGSAMGLAALYQGMAIGAMGVVAPIAGTSAMLPFAVGVAQGERPALAQVVGVALAIAGVVLVSREPSGVRLQRATVALGLLSAAGFGLYLVFMDRAAEHGVAWPVLISRGASGILAAIAAVLLHATLTPSRSLLPAIALVGVLDVTASLLFALATSHGLLSVVSVLASLYPVVTIVLAHALLHERLAKVQRVGAASALGGAALIAAG